MIKSTKKNMKTPTIEELFYQTDKLQGISLFSSATEDDKEITGLNPVLIITENELITGTDTKIISDPLIEIDKLIEEYTYLPDEVSLLGFIAYDYKDRFEEKGLYDKRSLGVYPDIYFALYEHYIISSRDKEKCELITLQFPFDYKRYEYINEKPAKSEVSTIGNSYYRGTSLDRNKYKTAVEKTVEYIRKGDIYQANITRAIYGETSYTPLQTALKLYHSNRISYGVFASIPGCHVISTSPELFFRVNKGFITASPIKGTITRSNNRNQDLENKKELLNSEKNIAELAMIIDLLRNDISLVCRPGTVNVPRFPILMTLENVYHLYADVIGELLPGTRIGDILRKTFPGGSITGCPKIRSCQIIDELEDTPRGIYTGSFGRISFNGTSIFNIMIRSLFQSGSSIIFNVGGGITLLSDPEDEYEETIHKGRNIWKAINMENIKEEQYCTEET